MPLPRSLPLPLCKRAPVVAVEGKAALQARSSCLRINNTASFAGRSATEISRGEYNFHRRNWVNVPAISVRVAFVRIDRLLFATFIYRVTRYAWPRRLGRAPAGAHNFERMNSSADTCYLRVDGDAKGVD